LVDTDFFTAVWLLFLRRILRILLLTALSLVSLQKSFARLDLTIFLTDAWEELCPEYNNFISGD